MEVVGGVVEMLAPVEAEPADVFLDRIDVLLLFLDRVRVVEAQVAAPAELLGDPEVERDRLRVADVEVAVRLGGKRVTTFETLPSRTSAATISRMKSLRSGVAGLSPLAPLLLISKRVVQSVAMSRRWSARRVAVVETPGRDVAEDGYGDAPDSMIFRATPSITRSDRPAATRRPAQG
jgi:hypothetical protein